MSPDPMPLILDLSPMLINRTAVFNIGEIITDTLATSASGYQYFGRRLSHKATDDETGALRRVFDEFISSGQISAAGAAASRNPQEAIFFLDPLYVLFCDLTAQDRILIHDLSPLTHPGWHQPQVSRMYRRAFDKIAASGAHVISVSRNTASTYYANFGYTRDPIGILPLFVPDHISSAASRRYSYRNYVLFVGSLESRKNLVGLIQAYSLSGLAREGCELLIVGSGGHGEERSRRPAQETPGVRLMGFVDNSELAGLYGGASAFAYPSYLEGFGVPLLEALHHGLPAVASCTGACPEVGGELAAYCDPDDHVAMAQEMIRLVHMPPDERQRHAVKAKAYVDANYSIELFRKRVLDLFADGRA